MRCEFSRTRARVNQRLYFDMGTFYDAFGKTAVSILHSRNLYNINTNVEYSFQYPAMFEGKEIPQSAYDRLDEVKLIKKLFPTFLFTLQ